MSPADRLRVLVRSRSSASSLRRLSSAFASLAHGDRLLPAAVALLVLVASLLSVAPTGVAQRAIGAVAGVGTEARVAIAGLNQLDPLDHPDAAIGQVDAPNSGSTGGAGQAASQTGAGASDPGATQSGTWPIDQSQFEQWAIRQANSNEPAPSSSGAGAADGQGPFLEDGTLLKPLAVDTTVPDGSANLKSYTVRSGDTLTGIASRFGISMMTVWWANDLRTKDELHVGQKLVIPPVTGVVVLVTPGDTLDSIAADAKVSPDVIVEYNHLTDRTMIIGQTLIIPGGVGEAIPTPATPKPAPRSNTSSGGSTRPATAPRSYTGGRFAWPVIGGGNYISQYFHYSHQAIDIAADYGSTVVAAAGGTVIFAGWKNNGGGYQVWISHGSNLYTDYNHMSAVTVGVGQHVGGGQQVGRIGATGDATGPHLHFDVWIGMIWGSGSYRVNPLAYF